MENSYEEDHENHEADEHEEEQEQEQGEEQEEANNLEGEEQEEQEENEEEQAEEQEEQEENNDDEEQQDEENQEETEHAEAEEEEEEAEEEHHESGNAANESDDEEFAGFGDEEIPTSKSSKKRTILSDDSDEGQKEESENEEEEDESVTKKKKKHKKHKSHKKSHKKRKNKEGGGDEEEEEEAEEGGGGGGDEEEEEEDEEAAKEVQDELNDLNDDEIQSAQQDIEDNEASNQEEEIVTKKHRSGEQTNLERVLSNQKAENKRKHKRKNIDSEEITEIDNTISMIIAEMKNVAAEDRAANEKNLTSIGKIKMLPSVIALLQKSDYQSNMIDLGILGAIAEWLAPLPDRCLPNIQIREALIDALRDFGEIGSDYLKTSGVGKAVMFLYKHPKETKQNKTKLEKLIHNWSRPIFNLDANYKQMSKEERLQRDIEQVRSMRRNSGDGPGQSVDEILSANDKKKRKPRPGNESDRSEAEDPNKVLRPGDPGFVPRARVPAPSHKDYIIRPKSNIDVMESNAKKAKKGETRLEKHQKKFIEFKRTSKFQRAVTLSINDKH